MIFLCWNRCEEELQPASQTGTTGARESYNSTRDGEAGEAATVQPQKGATGCQIATTGKNFCWNRRGFLLQPTAATHFFAGTNDILAGTGLFFAATGDHESLLLRFFLL